MTGAGIGEGALTRVVDRRHDRGEGLSELALEHRSGRLHRTTRGQAGLQVCPQREPHERRVRQRLASVAGDVAEDHRQATVLEREHVVEVAARARAVRRTVGGGGSHRTEPIGRHREQRGLQQTHVLEQLPALLLQPPGAQRRQTRADAQRKR